MIESNFFGVLDVALTVTLISGHIATESKVFQRKDNGDFEGDVWTLDESGGINSEQ